MSNHVDERVVEMQFKNREFEKNISTSINSINDLKKSLDFKEADGNIKKIEKAANGISFDRVKNAANVTIENVSFKALAKIEIIKRAVDGVINSAGRLIKSMSFDQISEGWQKFQSQTTSIGTLISQGFGMDEVQSEMKKLQWFADETSYSLTDMTDNLSKFTAQNMGLEESRVAMEGIALIAAKAGQNAGAASTAMYQLSQALGRTMQKMDWQQGFINRNMDSAELRRAALEAGVAMKQLQENVDGSYTALNGTIIDETNFLDTLTEGAWMTADVQMELYRTYGAAVDDIYQYTQDFDALATEAVDALDGEVDAFSLAAFKAGQESRTFRDSIEATKDAVSSSWARVYESVVGNYEEQKVLWSDLTERLWTYVAGPVSALADRFEEWKEFGGRTALFSGIQYALEALDKIIEAVSAGFREIFPKKTSEGLVEASRNFESLMMALQPGEKLLNGISKAVSLLARTVKFALTIVKGASRVLGLVAAGIVYVVANIREFAAAVWNAIASSERFHDIAQKIVERFGKLRDVLRDAKNAFKEFIANFNGAESVGEFARKLVDGFKTIGPDLIATGKDIVVGLAKGIAQGAKNVWNTGVDLAKQFVAGFNKQMDIHSPSRLMMAEGLLIIAGLVAGLLLGISAIRDGSQTVGEALAESFRQFTDSKIVLILKNWASNIKATFNDLFPHLADSIAAVKSAFQAFFNVFIGTEEATWEERFQKFKENLDGGRIVAFGIGVAIISIGLAISKVFKQVVPIFTGIKKLISGLTTAVNALSGVFTSISGMFKKLSSAVMLRSLAVSVALIVASIGLLAYMPSDRAVEAAKALAWVAGSLAFSMAMFLLVFSNPVLGGDNLQKEVGNLGRMLLRLAVVFAIVAVVVKIMSKVPIESYDAVIAMGLVLGGMGVLVSILSKMNIDEKQLFKITAAFIPLSTAMLIMCLALKKILKLIPDMNLKDAASSFGIMLVLIGLMTAMSLTLKAAGNKPFAAAVALNLMMLAMLELVGILNLLGVLASNPATLVLLLKGVATWIGLIIAVLLPLAAVLDACGDAALKAGAGVLMMVVAIQLLVNSIKKFAKMKMEQTNGQVLGLAAIAAGLLVFATILAMLPTKGQKGVLYMAALLLAITVCIAILASPRLDTGRALTGALGMFLVIAAVALVFAAIGENKKATGAILAFTAAIVAITAALVILQLFEVNDILQRAYALDGIIVALAIAMAAASKVDSGKSIAAIVVATLAFGALLAAIAYFPEPKVNWTQLAAIAGGLSVVMLALAGASKFAGDTKQRYGLLIAATLSIGAFLAAISYLPQPSVDWTQIIAASAGIGLAMIAMAAAARIADGITDGLGAMVVLALSLIPIAYAFSVVLQNLDPGITGGQLLALALAMGLAVGALAAIASIAPLALDSVLLTGLLAIELIPIAFAFKMVLDALGPREAKDLWTVFGTMALAIAVLAGAALGLGALMAVAIPGAIVIAVLAAALIGIAFAFKLFSAAGLVFADAMIAIGNAAPIFATGVSTGLLMLAQTITNVTKQMTVQGFNLAYGVGYNIIAGFVGGIVDGLKSIFNVGDKMGSTFLGALLKRLDINSPSEETKEAAKQCVIGFIKGEASMEDVIAASGKLLGETALGGVLENIGDFKNAGSWAGKLFGEGFTEGAGPLANIASFLGFDGYNQAEMDKLTSKWESAVKYQKIAEEAFAKGEISIGDRTAAQRVAKEAENAMNDYAEKHHSDGFLSNLLGEFDLGEKIDEMMEGFDFDNLDVGGGAGGGAAEQIEEIVVNTYKLDKIISQVDKDLKKETKTEKKNSDITNKAKKATLAFGASLIDLGQEFQSNEDMIKQMTDAVVAYRDNLDQTAKSQIDLFSGFDPGEAPSIDAILKGFDAITKGVAEYEANVAKMAEMGYSNDIMDYVIAGGAEAKSGWAKTFASATSEQVAAINKAYAKAFNAREGIADAGVSAMIRSFGSDALGAYEYMGENAGEAFAQGLLDKFDAAAKVNEDFGLANANALRQALGIHSPSTVYMEMGVNSALGYFKGLSERLRKMAPDLESLVDRDLVGVLSKALQDALDRSRDLIQNGIADDLTLTLRIDDRAAMDTLADMRDTMNSFNAAVEITNAKATAASGARFSGTATRQPEEKPEPTSVTNLNYTQNNYSPKALPAIDIYRKTNRSLKTGLEAVK